MDSREFFHAMYTKRMALRDEIRERLELVRFKQYLEELVSPYIKKADKPKKAEDVIKFTWELQRKMSIEEMKEAFHVIASSYKPPRKRKLNTRPPKHLQKPPSQMKRTKYLRKPKGE